jgi:hypothetical protein
MRLILAVYGQPHGVANENERPMNDVFEMIPTGDYQLERGCLGIRDGISARHLRLNMPAFGAGSSLTLATHLLWGPP